MRHRGSSRHPRPSERARDRFESVRRARALRRRHARRWPYPSAYAPGNRVSVYYEGEPCYTAMLDAIAGAKRSVHLETYLLRSDTTGWRFAHALKDRAADGIECALMYDAVGGMPVSSEYLEYLRDGGVHVLEYHPILPWRRAFNLIRRNHRKILAVDGTVAFVGGMNISDHAILEENGGEAWLDVHMRVEGPAAVNLARLFIEEWTRQGGPELTPPEVRGAYADGVPVRVVENRAHLRRALVRAAYLDALRHAKERIWLLSGYFAPDRWFVRALEAAARRGVDVRIIVPGKSDINVVKWAGQHLYDRLLSGGIRLFEWHETVLHAKAAVVDGRWVTIGTYNLDHRSIRYNLEVNAMILDGPVALAVERGVEGLAERAEELGVERWRKRSALHRLRSWFCYLFRAWL